MIAIKVGRIWCRTGGKSLTWLENIPNGENIQSTHICMVTFNDSL